jgi:hypothetical protein
MEKILQWEKFADTKEVTKKCKSNNDRQCNRGEKNQSGYLKDDLDKNLGI